MPEQKDYLGDGVYVAIEHGELLLTTEDGIRVTNRIVLEGPVYAALVAYVHRIRVEQEARSQEARDA